MLDLERLRHDTPGCLERVFLDSAGSSLPPQPVLATVIGHLRREAEVGGYVAAAERADDLAAVRESLARLIGATPSEIALLDSATRAWSEFVTALRFEPGDRILISQVEYASNAITALRRAAATGATVEAVPSDPSGSIDLEALDRMLDDRVRLVSLVHVPTNGGLVNPVREVVDAAHRHGALVLLDACQSTGQVPIDVAALGVDALSATGRKWLRGPRGTGFLYVRSELASSLEPSALDLHGAEWTAPDAYRAAPDATRFELWECDVAARLGLGAAVDYLLGIGIDYAANAVATRAEVVRAGLSTLPGVGVHDLGKQRCGIVTFTVDGIDAADVREALADKQITVTVSGRSSTLLDMTGRGLDAVVRASPHYFVSDTDIDRFLDAVAKLH
ncbi:aminotransferase class V-fold PLP-dependent enzyme [Rhodococcus sp. SGAir0479]|uniref:aminotransferase class V-fold PLP-dependent enzyme n=1 Tax=Rhodococcus sp. SGAir0479 TaxID=2567884 RepID=UPI0010CCBBC9|nr:aminotransferase class V-fold PLP-dependent enzyme [Rhodococcus sp. SGAir0479]QCQ90132.1 aminotransferase class V-fold PLP-dependent enzyme [Rhodococcus sp. SGAir0479]